MRSGVITLIVAAALVAAAPVSAQKLSLADRVALLERQAANSQANNDLLNQLEQLRAETQSLRSSLEQLQHENEELKQRNRDQYLDLDGRLNRIEGGTAPAASSVPQPATVQPPAAVAAERPPAVHGDKGNVTQASDERAAYNVAFDALKAGRYADSAELFQSFLELYPNGVYTPNALYWLGESYYVTQNYALAQVQFRNLLERYPTHDKASGALLKLGLSLQGEGKTDAAVRTLDEVIAKYPNTDPARTAADRLRLIQIGQLR